MSRRNDLIMHYQMGDEKIVTRVPPDIIPAFMTVVARYITGEFKSGEKVRRAFKDRSGHVQMFTAQFTLEQAIEYRTQLINKGVWT